jgi:putative peptidoglycan lipid II flippase
MAVAGLLLLVAVRRVAGRGAVAGVPGTFLRAGAGALVAAVAGRLVADAVLRGVPGTGGSVVAGLAAGIVVLVVAGGVLLAAERDLAGPVLSRLRGGARHEEP